MAALQAKRKFLVIFAILEFLEDNKIPRQKTKTRNWQAKRKQQGLYVTIRELSLEDSQGFKEIMRMGDDTFQRNLEPDRKKYILEAYHDGW